VFSLCGTDRKLEVTVRELRPKASYIRDVEIEEYEYRGFVITIHQHADTIGTAVPSYFAVVAKPNSKSGRVMEDYSQFIEVAKNDAEIYVGRSRFALESLFLDEGFGSLDPETLDVAIQGIETLGSSDRLVGIVSHIPELAERMSGRISVRKAVGGNSIEVS